MYRDSFIKKISIDDLNSTIAIGRFTALWGFSEAALGGILHALRIPFTGLFIGGAAVIFISLIAFFSDKRGVIFRSTLIVIIVKAAVSPHTPLTAYFAVFLQGIIGEVLFAPKGFNKISAIALGLITMLLSAFQKIIVLTLVFGNTLWDSIDLFADFIIKQLSFLSLDTSINYSYLLIGGYILIHCIGGLLAGITAALAPGWITNALGKDNFNFSKDEELEKPSSGKKPKRKWWLKKSNIIFFAFASLMVLLSFTHPDLGENIAYKILFMIARVTVILFIWYAFVSPYLFKVFRKYIYRKKNNYSEEIENIILLFPQLRLVVKQTWKDLNDQKGLKKIKEFISLTLARILTVNFK